MRSVLHTMNRRKGKGKGGDNGLSSDSKSDGARASALQELRRPSEPNSESNVSSGTSTPDSEGNPLPKQILLERHKRPNLKGKGRYSSYT